MVQELEKEYIFTKHDKTLTKALNADPLGFQVIWTYFGQKIYKNKINSATFDIRLFNFNLFNHVVIYQLIQDDNKTDIGETLILLENMLIWSWFKNQNEFIKKGLNGTEKAEKNWNIPNITIDKLKQDLIKSQSSTGVNGRYKGAFVEMGFFDTDYNYDNEKMKNVLDLIKRNRNLSKLYDSILEWFKDINIEKIPTLLVFGSVDKLAKHTKDFWLENLGFNDGLAKILYKNINTSSSKELFEESLEKDENNHFSNILTLEPILAYMDLLFNYILTLDGVEIKELKKYFEPIKNFKFESFDEHIDESSRVKDRFSKLIEMQQKGIEGFILYHQDLMSQRDRLPWIEIKDTKLKILKIQQDKDYKAKLDKYKDNYQEIEWIHDYYRGSIRRIKESLEP